MQTVEVTPFMLKLGESRTKDPTSFAKQDSFTVTEDTTLTLGRSDLKESDPKVSREQIKLFLNNGLFVHRVGRNQSFIIRSDWKQHQELPKDDFIPVHDGDLISLMSDEYWLQVNIKTKPNNKRKIVESTEQPKKKQKMITNQTFTLAFLPISVGENQYNPNRAFKVLLKALEQYCSQHVYPVHIYKGTSDDFNKLLDNYNFESMNVTVIDEMLSQPTHCIVNEVNWRFTKGNSKIQEMDSTILPKAKEKYGKATVGQVYPIQVEIQLKTKWVLNIVAPNMNPNKPDCLEDYDSADRILLQTYENVFSAFVDICKSVEPKKQTEEKPKTTETNIIFPPFDAPPVAFGTTKGGSWDNALITIANTLSSETNKRRTFYADDKIAIVYDPYAKAKMHLLCIYRSNIDNPTQLKTEHVELLKHAHTIAKQVAAHLRVDMMIGYHAIPSMRRLHFHIISRDLVSDCIKNKKHYNSFATDFFLPCNKVLAELESKGKVTIDKTKYENLLKNDLKCHRCKTSQKNIPKLKEHLEQCNK